MSSPVHHAKGLDTALMYAPPWARDEAGAAPLVPDASKIEWPPRRRRAADRNRMFSGDLAVLELQRRLSLDPERVPEPVPVRNDRTLGRIVLRICAAACVAALAAWAVVSVPALRQGRIGGADAMPATTITVDRGKQDQMPGATVAAELSGLDAHAADAEPRPAEIAPPTVAQPALSPTDGPSPKLDEEEIGTLLKRGQDFLKDGDFVSARLLLRRAAEAGNARAALALGETFDPAVVQRLGAIGVKPDGAKAREWYEKAAQLGSDLASQQLARLVPAHE